MALVAQGQCEGGLGEAHWPCALASDKSVP